MILGLFVIVVCAGIYGLGSVRMNPLEVLPESPTPHVDAAGNILGTGGIYWMSIVTLLASITTVNTLLCGTSRFLYGMAQREQMPGLFGKLSKFGTPWVGILICGIIIEVVMVTGVATAAEFVTLILASMCCYCISYIIAHIDVIVLRVRYPRVHRPFKSPFFPVPQILSMGAMVYMIYSVHPDWEITKAVWTRAGIIMAVIIVYAIVWLSIKKKPLFKPVPLDQLMERIEQEAGPVEVPIPESKR